MDLYICTKTEFYFSKKKRKKEKRNQKGVLIATLHTAWPKTFVVGQPSFCYFYELWKGTRKIIGFQRKPLLKLTIAGVF